jgi:hypothetical protein
VVVQFASGSSNSNSAGLEELLLHNKDQWDSLVLEMGGLDKNAMRLQVVVVVEPPSSRAALAPVVLLLDRKPQRSSEQQSWLSYEALVAEAKEVISLRDMNKDEIVDMLLQTLRQQQPAESQ